MKKNNDEWKIQIRMWLGTSRLEYSRFRLACDRWLTIMVSTHTFSYSEYILSVKIIIYFRFQKNNMKIEIFYCYRLRAEWERMNEECFVRFRQHDWWLICLHWLSVPHVRRIEIILELECVCERFTGIT